MIGPRDCFQPVHARGTKVSGSHARPCPKDDKCFRFSFGDFDSSDFFLLEAASLSDSEPSHCWWGLDSISLAASQLLYFLSCSLTLAFLLSGCFSSLGGLCHPLRFRSAFVFVNVPCVFFYLITLYHTFIVLSRPSLIKQGDFAIF